MIFWRNTLRSVNLKKMNPVHATSIMFSGKGLLLCGPSGAGKTDLALRLIQEGGLLIADDYTQLQVEDGRLIASPPPTIKGMIEIRGAGLVHVPYCEAAPVEWVVNLVPTTPDRMPERKQVTLLGVALPSLDLMPFEASAVAKLALMLQYPPAA